MGNIVIVDDHPLVRMALRCLLEQNGHSIMAEVDNGLEAIQCARTCQPDIVILDLDIPKLDGLAVMSHLTANHFAVKILILTSSAPENFAARCLKAGASGFMSKLDALDEVVDAVKALMSGRTFFPQSALQALQESFPLEHNNTPAKLVLTNRETTVLRLLGQGKNNQEVAAALFISHKTVSTYKVRLLKKFNTTHLVAMVDAARRMNFI